MNGMVTNASSAQHNGSSAYAMQGQPQSQQGQSGGAAGASDVYGMSHHVNGAQGYYGHAGHMTVSSMAAVTGQAAMNGAPQRLPSSMSNGTYNSAMMAQRMAPDSAMMPGMTNPHQGVHHPPGPQYGAHHPGAPVPQPYGGPAHSRYMMSAQNPMKSEMPPSR